MQDRPQAARQLLCLQRCRLLARHCANDNTVKLWLLSPELASWGPGEQVSSGSGNEALLHAHGSTRCWGTRNRAASMRRVYARAAQ